MILFLAVVFKVPETYNNMHTLTQLTKINEDNYRLREASSKQCLIKQIFLTF
jgi:hypothetical protein